MYTAGIGSGAPSQGMTMNLNDVSASCFSQLENAAAAEVELK
jgi:hypothetical protein